MTDEILRMEPDDGLEKLADALKICQLYRDMYFTKRSGLQAYFKELAVVEWDFQPSLIFTRLDRFIEQLKMMEVFFFQLDSVATLTETMERRISKYEI